MISRVTMDVLESYLFCRYKGYLKWIGHQGIKSDYEVLLAGAREEVRLTVIEKLITQHRQDQAPRGIPLTDSVLKQGLPFILEPTLEDATISLSFDGLKKAHSPSKLGDFHYIPMLFHGEHQFRKEQRLMLEMCGLFLSRYQGIMPVNGIIWRGRESKPTKIRLNSDPRNVEQLFTGLQEMLNSEAPPKLILNEHCQVCEFRVRCHNQTVQEDNLSLLCGMSEKGIKKLGKKGIRSLRATRFRGSPRRTASAWSALKKANGLSDGLAEDRPEAEAAEAVASRWRAPPSPASIPIITGAAGPAKKAASARG